MRSTAGSHSSRQPIFGSTATAVNASPGSPHSYLLKEGLAFGQPKVNWLKIRRRAQLRGEAHQAGPPHTPFGVLRAVESQSTLHVDRPSTREKCQSFHSSELPVVSWVR